ncbi:AzlD domain-containing protein [Brevibacillus agri]|uniref:AzlD domain-containing protein n=1 Tax=Brevibacillus agri TaxID=51101 RepID=UPI0030F39A29
MLLISSRWGIPAWLRRGLAMVPVGVFSSMTIPPILFHAPKGAWSPEYVVAGAVALAVGFWKKQIVWALLAYTWNSKDANESAVRWELLPEAEGCRLVLDHSMRASEPLPRMLAGWHAHLELLAKVLAGEQPAWSWSRWEQLREAYAQKWGE